MESRDLFLKGEIKLLEKILNGCYDYCPYSSALDDERRFKKIIKLVFEINEKVLTLKKRIKGSI